MSNQLRVEGPPVSVIYNPSPEDSFPNLIGQLTLANVLSEVREDLRDLKGRVQTAICEKLAQMAPVGIANEAGNCWANAILQLVMSDPALLNQILESEQPEIEPLKDLVTALLYESDGYEASVESQVFREWVSAQVAGDDIESIPIDPSVQIDIAKPLQLLTRALDGEYTFARTREYRALEAQTVLCTDPMRSEQKDTVILSMDPTKMTEPQFFEGLVHAFFENPLEGGAHGYEVSRFASAPNSLRIQANRFGRLLPNDPTTDFKIQGDLVGVPELYELPSRYLEEETEVHYELSSCIIHLGNRVSSGHYVTLLKKEDGFYHVNDESVFKWNGESWDLVQGHFERNPIHNERMPYTPKEMMAQGCFFNYRKVLEIASEEPQAAAVLQVEEERVHEPEERDEPPRPRRCCGLESVITSVSSAVFSAFMYAFGGSSYYFLQARRITE